MFIDFAGTAENRMKSQIVAGRKSAYWSNVAEISRNFHKKERRDLETNDGRKGQ